MAENDEEPPPAFALVESLNTQFAGNERPVTAEEMARLYGVLGHIVDSLISLAALASKMPVIGPISPRAKSLEASLNAAVEEMGKAMIDLGKKDQNGGQ